MSSGEYQPVSSDDRDVELQDRRMPQYVASPDASSVPHVSAGPYGGAGAAASPYPQLQLAQPAPMNAGAGAGAGTFLLPREPNEAEFLERVQTRVVQLDSERYFKDAWRMVKQNLLKFVGITIIVAGVSLGLDALWWAVYFRHHAQESNPYEDNYKENVDKSEALQNVLMKMLFDTIGALFVFRPFEASFYIAVFNGMRSDGTVKFGEFFSVFRSGYYFKLLPLSFVMWLFIQLGFLFFIIPGLFLMFFFVFALPIHKEHPYLGVFRTLNVSMKIARRYGCSLFGFFVLCVLVVIIGLLCLLVGVLVAIPVAAVAFCFLYNHTIGVNGCPLEPAAIVPMYVAFNANQPQQQLQAPLAAQPYAQGVPSPQPYNIAPVQPYNAQQGPYYVAPVNQHQPQQYGVPPPQPYNVQHVYGQPSQPGAVDGFRSDSFPPHQPQPYVQSPQ